MDTKTKATNSSSERRLAAILFADIQGYTALMQRDEKAASTLLKRFQTELKSEVVSHNGNMIQFYGDGALVTFNSPLEAIRCALGFQKTFSTDPVVPVRTGIHLGTIVLEGGMAYGDSINIASRIESLAIPGSILVSKRVRDELKNQPDISMRSVGEFEFKNVAEPIEVFAIVNPGLNVPDRKHMTGKLKSTSTPLKKQWPALTVMGIIVVALISWLIYRNNAITETNDGDTGPQLQKLAVLPFTNIRGEKDAEFLSLALANEIISDLNYSKDILVRPASAVRKYAQTSIDAPTAGEELDVDFILVGNYIKEGEALRIGVELVDVDNNELLWQQNFVGEYENTFQLQDQVSDKVLTGLNVSFSDIELQLSRADVSQNPLAYEYYLKGVALPSVVDENRVAIDLVKKSIELDSTFAPAWSELGWRQKYLAAYTLGEGHQIEAAEQSLEKALELNPKLLSAFTHIVAIYVETGRIDKAVETARKALEINPNNALNHMVLGYVYRYAGFLEEAEEEEAIALKLDPNNLRIKSSGLTQIYLGKYKDALERFENNSKHPFSLAWQGQLHLRLGDNQKALELFDKVIEMDSEGVGHWVKPMKYHLEGEPDKGFEALQKLEINLVDAEQYYNIANLYGLIGNNEACIRALRKTVSRGFFSYPVLQHDPFLDPVRSDPDFLEVLEEARLKHEAFGRRYF